MKTSDKILLYSTLGAIGLFLTVDLLHYAKYRTGEVLTYQDLRTLDFTTHDIAGIHWLVLDGPMRTTITPANHFQFDLDKSMEHRFYYYHKGDSLLIYTRQRTGRQAHDGVQSYLGYPAIQIFCPPLKGIHIINGFANLENQAGRKGLNADFLLDSTQLWIGAYDFRKDTVYQIEPWDSIKVNAVNSNIVFNRQAHVKVADLRLDDRSEVSDRFSTIDTGRIQGDTNTVIHMRGKNFKKIRLDAVVHSAP